MQKQLRAFAWTIAALQCWCPVANADPPTAAKVIEQIDALEKPVTVEGGMTKAEHDAWLEKYNAYTIRRAELAAELWEADPDNDRLLKLLPDRWGTMLYALQSPERIEDEANRALAGPLAKKIEKQAIYFRASGEIATNDTTADAALNALDRITQHQLDADKRYTRLLASTMHAGTPAARLKLMDIIEKRTTNQRLLDSIAEQRSQLTRIGEQVELEFDDAITGKHISMASLRGKVVVLDFWATWCRPCIAEMPHLKEVYAEYKDRGVEFIGVSLDYPKEKGGLDRLKAFIKKNEIPWPQYYQGNAWDSEFSSSWGIELIPALFLIDQQGKMHSLDARSNLADQLDALLANNSE